LMERERELLLLLGRETRGTKVADLFVRSVVSAQDDDHFSLVMPAVLGGELFQLLQDVGRLPEKDVQFYAACITVALQHLHGLGIAYRDLKTENVLLSCGVVTHHAGWPVLSDFGLANFVKAANLTTFCGTPAFMAPEVAAATGYGTAADWWSFGILIHQCLTLTTPFEGSNPKATIENIRHNRRVNSLRMQVQEANRDGDGGAIGVCGSEGSGGVGGKDTGGGGGLTEERTPRAIPAISAHAEAMIDSLLELDPAERLGGPLRANDVRTMPFFWGFDWRLIESRRMIPPHADWCRDHARALTRRIELPPLPSFKIEDRRRTTMEESPHEAAKMTKSRLDRATAEF